MKTAFATGDGESFTNRHFGDNDYYDIYDITASEKKFIKRIQEFIEQSYKKYEK